MYKYIKRFFDFVSALLALIVFSLLLAVVAVLVKIKLGSPVIFKQERPGLNNKVFTLYKFRTMTGERDKNGELLPDEVRLTKFGQFLRNTSIDELPELINILKGDMSVIGPRPLLVQYIPLYNKHQARRAEVKPGLSGWAQVNGRNSVTWEDKFDMDVYYADNYSLALDLKILFMTVKNVIKREGISSDTSATMEPFTGTSEKKEETQNA
ncbi:MAG TPA: sugar transferase [Candidatus Eubacterium faecigallinarum]|nr:sugar transferase [Candidatus Eubacterium faecigallinarum]